MEICKVENLCKDYSAFSLKKVSFTLESGKITGFIGRNGAGKTTVIKSMLNIIHPTSGSITFFGKSISEDKNEILQKIGYSSGAVNYYKNRKIKDIAAITKPFYSNWDDEAYKNYLDLFEIDENKTPASLSEGMKVKFNLVLALSHNAKLIILDEPTNALDPFAREEVNDSFLKLKNEGVSIFFSTHITSDIEKCADNIILISNGRILKNGSKEEITSELCKNGESLERAIIDFEKENEK